MIFSTENAFWFIVAGILTAFGLLRRRQ